MSYTITIEQNLEVTKTVRGEYQVVGHQYLSASDYNQLSFDARKDWRKETEEQYVKNLYDYAPPAEKVSTVTKKILEQTIEDIDLQAIIVAINNLG